MTPIRNFLHPRKTNRLQLPKPCFKSGLMMKVLAIYSSLNHLSKIERMMDFHGKNLNTEKRFFQSLTSLQHNQNRIRILLWSDQKQRFFRSKNPKSIKKITILFHLRLNNLGTLKITILTLMKKGLIRTIDHRVTTDSE